MYLYFDVETGLALVSGCYDIDVGDCWTSEKLIVVLLNGLQNVGRSLTCGS